MQVNNLVQVQSFFVELFRPIFEEVITDSINKINSGVSTSTPPATTKPESYVTKKQASELYQVSEVTLWKWEKLGLIQGYRIGKLLRYKHSELVEAMSKINRKK